MADGASAGTGGEGTQGAQAGAAGAGAAADGGAGAAQVAGQDAAAGAAGAAGAGGAAAGGGSLAQGGAAGAADKGAAAGAGAATLAGGQEVKVDPVVTPADWPENWRDRLVGEDKAALKQLERLGSPADLFKSYKALQARLSSGQLKAALPADATPEQITEWRKDNGIPETPAAYLTDLKLPNGMIPGEKDKPLLESFAKTAHDNNWSPEQYGKALSWYYGMQDQLAAQRVEADDAYKVDAMTELTTEWGREYKPNINALGNLMALFPEGAADMLFGGRTADGKLIGDNPAILRGLVAVARELNPAATILPAGSGSTVADIDTRINELNKLMKDNASAYWSKDTGPAIQAEYRSLIDAKEKMKGRAA